MSSDNELLKELQRLNRAGLINDEEFLVLRSILQGKSNSPEHYIRFDQLFAGKSRRLSDDIKAEKRVAELNPPDSENRLYSITEAIDQLGLRLLPQQGSDISRELLTCPACGMFEVVAVDSRVITVESDYPKDDTGLKFTKVKSGEWECPDCGHLIPSPSPE